MKALLLAAGFGTRLKPLAEKMPKALVPICGRPVLEYWLEASKKAGIQDIIVNTHYLADQVDDYLKKSSYDVTTFYEEELLGTGGTLLANKEFFGEESVLLVHADNVSLCDLVAFKQAHESRPDGCLITMMSFETTDPGSCGILELDKDGIVIEFHEKVANPPGNLANAAVYILEPEIFKFLNDLNKNVIDFSTEVLPNFLGRIYTWHNDKYHRDIGTPQSYETANVDFCKLYFEEN